MADEKQTAQDSAELDTKAFEIYQSLLQTMVGFNSEHVAQEAYKRAASFLKVASLVRSGKLSTETVTPKAREYVKVRLQRAKPEGVGFDDILDEKGEPIVKELPCDPHAYCPNLSETHPANQRFRPEDGISFKNRIEAHRKAMKVGAN